MTSSSLYKFFPSLVFFAHVTNDIVKFCASSTPTSRKVEEDQFDRTS